MNKSLKVSKNIVINSSSEKVWDALTNPEKIRIYLFGTKIITDWRIGSSIIFQGEYEGGGYTDKGNVLENTTHETLKYDYWSEFYKIEDIPDNYSIITYHIEKISNNKVKLTWTQEGFASEAGQQHSENTLYGMLEQIKYLIENE